MLLPCPDNRVLSLYSDVSLYLTAIPFSPFAVLICLYQTWHSPIGFANLITTVLHHHYVLFKMEAWQVMSEDIDKNDTSKKLFLSILLVWSTSWLISSLNTLLYLLLVLSGFPHLNLWFINKNWIRSLHSSHPSAICHMLREKIKHWLSYLPQLLHKSFLTWFPGKNSEACITLPNVLLKVLLTPTYISLE